MTENKTTVRPLNLAGSLVGLASTETTFYGTSYLLTLVLIKFPFPRDIILCKLVNRSQRFVIRIHPPISNLAKFQREGHYSELRFSAIFHPVLKAV